MKRVKYIIITTVSAILLSSFTAYRSDFFEIAKQIEIFTALYKELNMNYVDEVNPAELMDTAIVNMLEDLDPYTNFYNEQDVANARINRSASYTKLGLNLRNVDDEIIISDLQKGFAADLSGLKLGDKILKIDGLTVEDFKDNLDNVLSGRPNTSVNLEVLRNAKNETITLKRSFGKETSVPFYGMVDEKTGYVVLSQFTRTASRDVGKAVLELKGQGAQQLILDLRGNPGGLLTEAVNVSNIFLPKDQLIVYTKSQIEKFNATYATQKEPIDTEIPLVVLINDNSASASEIVSGSLQDLDRAVVIGSRSFGKGLVQRPKPLKYGTQVKITISRYFLPSGRGIQALDYKDGKSIRKSIQESKAFKTKNGRTVYDGGGINPDISIKAEKISDFTKQLDSDLLFLKFANQFYYAHPELDVNTFQVDDKIFQSFVKFVKNEDYTLKTDTDKALENLIETASLENFDDKFIKDLKGLENSLSKEKDAFFDIYKAEISSILTDQIIKHYAYSEGIYEYDLKNADVIKEALNVFENTTLYKKTLNLN
jgi:carboxyl-terminal processing protease